MDFYYYLIICILLFMFHFDSFLASACDFILNIII